MGKKTSHNNKENQQVHKQSINNNQSRQNQLNTIRSSTIDNTLMFRKKQWTEKQDRLLIKTIKEYGPKKWSTIAEFIPGRIGKQCRQRWHNHLNPKINKQEWSQLQQWALFLMHIVFGGKWARMTKTLSKRTDNSIKNHWNSIMQKKMDYYSQKLSQIKNQSETNQMQLQGQEELNKQINNLLRIIRNQEVVSGSSVSLPMSRNQSQINEDSLTSNFNLKSKQELQQSKSQNSLNIKTSNLLQPFRNSSQDMPNSSEDIQNLSDIVNQMQCEDQVLLQKNISFFNSKVSSDIGLEELLQKYDHVPHLTKKNSYNYFPSCKLTNQGQLNRQNSYQLLSNKNNNRYIDQNYQSPTKYKNSYAGVFDEQNQQNIALPQPKQLDSPLVPLLRRKSSRNKSYMSPSRFLQRKTSSNENC